VAPAVTNVRQTTPARLDKRSIDRSGPRNGHPSVSSTERPLRAMTNSDFATATSAMTRHVEIEATIEGLLRTAVVGTRAVRLADSTSANRASGIAIPRHRAPTPTAAIARRGRSIARVRFAAGRTTSVAMSAARIVRVNDHHFSAAISRVHIAPSTGKTDGHHSGAMSNRISSAPSTGRIDVRRSGVMISRSSSAPSTETPRDRHFGVTTNLMSNAHSIAIPFLVASAGISVNLKGRVTPVTGVDLDLPRDVHNETTRDSTAARLARRERNDSSSVRFVATTKV
jgi:hypothetical protein